MNNKTISMNQKNQYETNMNKKTNTTIFNDVD